MPPDVSALEAHLGYWLRRVSNQVSHSFAAKVAAEGVTVAEWVALRELLSAEPVAPGVLASRLGMTRGAVSKLADRLVAKGLASREGDPGDGRRQVLALTVPGRALVPRLATLADANDTEFFGHLAASERESLERTMRELVRRHGIADVPVD